MQNAEAEIRRERMPGGHHGSSPQVEPRTSSRTESTAIQQRQ
jgi:hypothetical protein